MTRMKFGAIVVALVLFGLARAQAQGDGSAASSAPPPATANEQVGPDYLVGPGDSLRIFVWDHADLSASVAVRPDGRISTPLVEDLQAAGKSTTSLARDIEKVLSEYVRSPVVTVMVEKFIGDVVQQVRVVGAAAAPRALQYRQGMTVLDVVIEVGGLSEFAAGNRAKLLRTVDGEKVEMRVRLDDLINRGKIEENVPILPGDVLVIPESIL